MPAYNIRIQASDFTPPHLPTVAPTRVPTVYSLPPSAGRTTSASRQGPLPTLPPTAYPTLASTSATAPGTNRTHISPLPHADRTHISLPPRAQRTPEPRSYPTAPRTAILSNRAPNRDLIRPRPRPRRSRTTRTTTPATTTRRRTTRRTCRTATRSGFDHFRFDRFRFDRFDPRSLSLLWLSGRCH
jgi:hypothetical protein